jgi:hypothetical protein
LAVGNASALTYAAALHVPHTMHVTSTGVLEDLRLSIELWLAATFESVRNTVRHIFGLPPSTPHAAAALASVNPVLGSFRTHAGGPGSRSRRREGGGAGFGGAMAGGEGDDDYLGPVQDGGDVVGDSLPTAGSGGVPQAKALALLPRSFSAHVSFG